MYIAITFYLFFSSTIYSLLSREKSTWNEGGDSSGISETAETPQERSDEEAWPRPRKASTRSGMCSPIIDFLLSLSSYYISWS